MDVLGKILAGQLTDKTFAAVAEAAALKDLPAVKRACVAFAAESKAVKKQAATPTKRRAKARNTPPRFWSLCSEPSQMCVNRMAESWERSKPQQVHAQRCSEGTS